MSVKFVKRNSAFCVLFLITFLNSCTPHCNQWKLAIVKSDCPCATYVKAYLPTCNTFNGLEAVLTSYNGSVKLYLNAFTLNFPFYNGDEEHSEVSLLINDEKFTFVAERLQGGQCLLLPEDGMQLITGALLEHKCVDVIVGRFQTTLTYENFQKTYCSLTNF